METITITVPERKTLRSSTAKYLANRIGFNVKPDEPYFVENDNLWIVKCKAYLTNYVTNLNQEGKQFTYTFENIGQFVYAVEGEKLRLLSKPLKTEIDKEITDRYVNLSKEIEKQLLISGSNSWGKLTLVRHFLSPLYNMVSELLNRGYLSFNEITSEQNYKFFRLLLHAGYISMQSDAEDIFIKSNKLIRLSESQIDSSSNLYGQVENVVGVVFGNYYDTIKYDIGIRPPSSYVDYAKSYYFDALRYGDLIKLDENDIIDSLENFDIYITKENILNFRRSLLELSSTELLSKDGDYYTGNQRIFNNLYQIRGDLINNEVYM